MSEPKIRKGIYKHYKGHLYKAVGLARHSETMEWMVIYETRYENPEGKVWVRPLTMFTETVSVNGKKTPRFEYLGKK